MTDEDKLRLEAESLVRTYGSDCYARGVREGIAAAITIYHSLRSYAAREAAREVIKLALRKAGVTLDIPLEAQLADQRPMAHRPPPSPRAEEGRRE